MRGIKVDNSGKQLNGAYRREMKRSWFMEEPFYRRYALREFTAVTNLIYTIVLIFGLAALGKGKEAFVAWTQAQSGGAFVIAFVAFLLALYHTYTWFAATPKALPLQFGAKKVPAKQIILGNWVVFAILTVVILLTVGAK